LPDIIPELRDYNITNISRVPFLIFYLPAYIKLFLLQPLDNQNKLPTFAVLKLRDKNIKSLKGKNAYYPTIS
jgi:hypothetical protein